jgi:dimethylamine/trimethylamine dehydrogenase
LDESIGDLGFSNAEVREFIEMNHDLPDLWDLAQGSWEDCSGPSRFKEEAAQEVLVTGIRALSSKPVVGVGRFTSPDVMVRMIRQGRLDFIGCARPSIADPFLPKKIEEGRIEDIRECIGCNICITGDMTQGMGRCTQNPTWMEEWRRGWHPEKVAAKGDSHSVLVVGSGPAGLEAARIAAERGYDVAVAEVRDVLGGRVARERLLPGLSAWGRVADYRLYQLGQKPNVQLYPGSGLTADDIIDFGFQHICIATGARWRADGVARQHVVAIPKTGDLPVFTPDDLMEGRLPTGKVVLFDDDHYYMGGVLAELLATNGCEVTLITPSAFVSDWTANTLEQAAVHRRLAGLGVKIVLNTGLSNIVPDGVQTCCVYTGQRSQMACAALVMVGSRQSDDALFRALTSRQADWAEAGIRSVKVIGDAAAPAPIAWATFAGHRYARELDSPDIGDALSFRREVTALASD